MIRVKRFEFEELTGLRFSIIRMNRNIQTVHVFHLGNTLIDTGQKKSRKEVYENVSPLTIDKIVLTHHHEDHTGNAAYLKRKLHVPVYAHPHACKLLSQGLNIPPLGVLITGDVDRVDAIPLFESQVVDTGKYQLKPIFTPGHTEDHYAFYLKEKGWLFSGDLYVADRIKYFSDFESMKKQIESLKKLCLLDFEVLLCSHNPKFKNGKKHLQAKLQDLESFYGVVLNLYAKGYGYQEILHETGRKENKIYDFISLGAFNAENMVKSVLRDEGLPFKP